MPGSMPGKRTSLMVTRERHRCVSRHMNEKSALMCGRMEIITNSPEGKQK